MKQTTKVEKLCKICGTKYLVFRCEKNQRTHCSRKCFNVYFGEKATGIKNVNYKHGKSGSKEMIFRKNLRSVYKIDLEDKQNMLTKQDNKCAICKKTIILFGNKPDGSCIDHNHRTGKVRQLLCKNCNCGLGHFKEDLVLLGSAILYLKKWGI